MVAAITSKWALVSRALPQALALVLTESTESPSLWWVPTSLCHRLRLWVRPSPELLPLVLAFAWITLPSLLQRAVTAASDLTLCPAQLLQPGATAGLFQGDTLVQASFKTLPLQLHSNGLTVVTVLLLMAPPSPQPSALVLRRQLRTRCWASWVPVTTTTSSASPASSKFASQTVSRGKTTYKHVHVE